MGADRKAIVENINAGFLENNLERVLSFCTEDLSWTMVGDSTVKGKDAIRKWMTSMNPGAPQFTVHQMVAEGDVVIARGDMRMKDGKDGIAHSYAFCDIYRFKGDQVVDLTAFVIQTDKARAREETRQEVGRA